MAKPWHVGDLQLGVLRHLTPCHHHQAAEHTAHKQVADREDHPAVISNPAGRRGTIKQSSPTRAVRLS